jgi:hypothetical protein
LAFLAKKEQIVHSIILLTRNIKRKNEGIRGYLRLRRIAAAATTIIMIIIAAAIM